MFVQYLVVLLICLLAINPLIIYAQSNTESHVKTYKLILNGKEYHIPYVMANGTIKEIKTSSTAYGYVSLNVSTGEGKKTSLEISLPYDLFKIIFPYAMSGKFFDVSLKKRIPKFFCGILFIFLMLKFQRM